MTKLLVANVRYIAACCVIALVGIGFSPAQAETSSLELQLTREAWAIDREACYRGWPDLTGVGDRIHDETYHPSDTATCQKHELSKYRIEGVGNAVDGLHCPDNMPVRFGLKSSVIRKRTRNYASESSD